MIPTILLYNAPAELHKELKALGNTLGFSCKKIAKRRYLQPLGCHAGVPGYTNTADWYEGEDVSLPVILFAGFSEHLLDRFLAEYKQRELPEVSYRAVLTATNKDWTIWELYKELEREHAAMHQYDKR